MNDVALAGLEPDNLLAFLALLGLLRAVNAARPDWQPRIAWNGPPWKARLNTVPSVSNDDIVGATHDGLRLLAPAYGFGAQSDINWTAQEFRTYAEQLLNAGDREPISLLAALASDGAVKKSTTGKDASVAATALCAVFGQGHQHFLGQLERLRELAHASSTDQDIASAVFETWQYSQRKDALRFRWDPSEDRRYAYRHGNPSGEVVAAVPGANLLAALGFPLFVVAPGRYELRTLAFGRAGRKRFVAWPIWNVPLSLASTRALLAHPDLVKDSATREKLEPYGVVELMRADRIQVEKYFNFSRARPLWGATAEHAAPMQHGHDGQ